MAKTITIYKPPAMSDADFAEYVELMGAKLDDFTRFHELGQRWNDALNEAVPAGPNDTSMQTWPHARVVPYYLKPE